MLEKICTHSNQPYHSSNRRTRSHTNAIYTSRNLNPTNDIYPQSFIPLRNYV